MLHKALAARPGIGPSVLSTSLRKTIRQSQIEPPELGRAAGAIAIEDDFEMGGDFLLVFTLASERVAGFIVGCAVVGIAWATFSLF